MLNTLLHFLETVTWLSKLSFEPISGQCYHFMSPENTRQPKVFGIFKGYKIETFVRNGLIIFRKKSLLQMMEDNYNSQVKKINKDTNGLWSRENFT